MTHRGSTDACEILLAVWDGKPAAGLGCTADVVAYARERDRHVMVVWFPYGDENAHLIAVANRLGYVTVSWAVDTLGWQGASAGITVSEVAPRVLAALRPGEIVLRHAGSSPDGSPLDAHALPRVISELLARGYSFVTLNALAG